MERENNGEVFMVIFIFRKLRREFVLKGKVFYDFRRWVDEEKLKRRMVKRVRLFFIEVKKKGNDDFIVEVGGFIFREKGMGIEC